MNIIKVRSIKANLTEVQIEGCDNPSLQGIVQVLVSYETPVVVKSGLHIFVTEQRYSRTTDRHIKHWLEGYPGVPAENIHKIPQWAISEVFEGGPSQSLHYTEAIGFTFPVAR